MTVVLDTTALIDIYNDNKKLKSKIESLEENIATTIMNYQEIFFGIDLSEKKYEEEKRFFEELFDKVIMFDLSQDAAKKASEILYELTKKGKIIGKMDCIIAGIILTNGTKKIITRNKGHFENIKGLEVINY